MTDAQQRQTDSLLLAKRAAQLQSGRARAAVLGVNDGLVSTLCLVIGVAAAGATNQAVLMAGFAGLIAGAVSMAAGEWISVKSQVDLFEGVLNDLKLLVKRDKELLVENLSKSFSDNGASKQSADHAAADIAKSDKQLFQSYATEVVGMNPDELGSPWRAASASFVLFVAGAFVPLLPWMVTGGVTALVSSIALTGAAGLVVGGYIARSSGKSIWFGALRQLSIIILASAVTYGVGTLFGVAIG
jgi:vacuolar iron transporter family protein